jgi:hypothetical protein
MPACVAGGCQVVRAASTRCDRHLSLRRARSLFRLHRDEPGLPRGPGGRPPMPAPLHDQLDAARYLGMVLGPGNPFISRSTLHRLSIAKRIAADTSAIPASFSFPTKSRPTSSRGRHDVHPCCASIRNLEREARDQLAASGLSGIGGSSSAIHPVYKPVST